MVDAELVVPVHVGNPHRDQARLVVRPLSDIQVERLLGVCFRLGRNSICRALAREALPLRSLPSEEAPERERSAFWTNPHAPARLDALRAAVVHFAGIGGN